MQWFQVTCPSCAAALQVKLPEGVTSVQCSQCKAVFGVQVQPTALAAQSVPAAGKRSRKRKTDKDTSGVPRTLSAYNVFMKGEVAKVKSEHPELAHREAFKMAAERWQASPMNPQNGGERFPALPNLSGPDSVGLLPPPGGEMEQEPDVDDGGDDGDDGDDGGDDGVGDGGHQGGVPGSSLAIDGGMGDGGPVRARDLGAVDPSGTSDVVVAGSASAAGAGEAGTDGAVDATSLEGDAKPTGGDVPEQ